jgi:hypothetical protein
MQAINEDISSDDNQKESNDLENQFLHPGYTWHGLTLRPYTAGTNALFKNILDYSDAPETIFLSFIFIHVEDREKLKILCKDKGKFFSALIDWLDTLGEVTSEDELAAMEIFEEIRGWARKSSVEVIPDPTLPEKKTRATNQPPSPV